MSQKHPLVRMFEELAEVIAPAHRELMRARIHVAAVVSEAFTRAANHPGGCLGHEPNAPNPCTCPCPGCRHHCAACHHQETR